jgi:integrase
MATREMRRMAWCRSVRPGELRQAWWVEIDFEASGWRTPAERMKARLPRIAPVAAQALAVLRALQPITGHSEFLFPSPRSLRRPMSNNAMLAAMRGLGIDKDVMCGHGFRSTARTISGEVLEYCVDWIEHQLAHAVEDANGRAYNRTAHLDKRKDMMQSQRRYTDVRKSCLPLSKRIQHKPAVRNRRAYDSHNQPVKHLTVLRVTRVNMHRTKKQHFNGNAGRRDRSQTPQ